MVGLPGCGKTFVSKRICRYISFFHHIPSQIFNVGDYRRELCGSQLPASFFDPNNADGLEKRHKACEAATADLVTYMKQDGVRLAIYDATNNLQENRAKILRRLKEENIGAKILFLEAIVDDKVMLEENIRTVKLSTPDYKGVDSDQALKDFMKRRENYAGGYTSVQDCEGSYVRVINYKKFEIHNVRGYLPLKVSESSLIAMVIRFTWVDLIVKAFILANCNAIYTIPMNILYRTLTISSFLSHLQFSNFSLCKGGPFPHEPTHTPTNNLLHPPRPIRIQPPRKNRWRLGPIRQRRRICPSSCQIRQGENRYVHIH